MKVVTTIVGVILIIFGLFTLSYQGYTYKTRENIADIGELHITAEKEKHVNFPPILGGGALVAGVALVAIARFGKK